MTGDLQNSRPGAARYVVGRSGPSLELESKLQRLAASMATILLQGESGSGKSRAARRLHELGPRAERPLVEVTLSALSASLVESELFGHEEGSFTGAHESRLGRFRHADGGAILLEGVEYLGLDLQVKLLRVLQERVVEPIGGQPVPVDLRMMATTSVDLRSRIAAGEFREDLYYRLAVVTLDVPPLRSRMSDLSEFTSALAEHAASRGEVQTREFSPEADGVLRDHGWPGNLRELENAVERVLVLGRAEDGEVQAEELGFLHQELRSEARLLASRALAQGLSVDDMELAMIEVAMEEQRGNLSGAARQVGLSRRALEYRWRRSQGQDQIEEDDSE